jgi:hypothetical protein
VKPNSILEATNLSEATNFVLKSNDLPYWLLVDSKLEGESGKELVDLVGKLGYPADVLYYSRAKPVPPLEGIKPPRYGKVFSVHWDDIPDRISFMAQEFLLKWTDPEYIRGLVLSRAVDVEIAMDDCVLAFFKVANSREPTFRSKLLGTHGAQLFARFDVLVKAIAEVRQGNGAGITATYDRITKEVLDQVFKDTRDMFAHNLLGKDPAVPFSLKIIHKSGGDIPYERKTLQKYFLTCSRMLADLQRLKEDLGVTNIPVRPSRRAGSAKRSTAAK